MKIAIACAVLAAIAGAYGGLAYYNASRGDIFFSCCNVFLTVFCIVYVLKLCKILREEE